ncbi:CoA transferase [Accumulibacter sp.]|uniref:CoA transferase n=1 Tax=Accumulibacter sp. TaxID=2053492 RepID=UPI003441A2A2
MLEGEAATRSARLHAAAGSAEDETPAAVANARARSENAPGDQQRELNQERERENGMLPMDGLRVIDVGSFLAGPYAASMLGEIGAEVLKVEHPIAGDPMRRFGTASKRHDATLAWLGEGGNRRSVTLDLRQREGVELFLRLVARSDVLIENSELTELRRKRVIWAAG